jgi:major membrane immunogen (membrane-anchored lipoprotein)
VIEDNGYHDVTVQFEDGTIVTGYKRDSIRRGEIKLQAHSILGQVYKMNNGQTCEVIDDKSYEDVTVRFEDGTIVEHCSRMRVKNGSIRNPNYNPNSILGQTFIMNNGQKCVVLEDNSFKEVTVQFEDGTVVENCLRSRVKPKFILICSRKSWLY